MKPMVAFFLISFLSMNIFVCNAFVASTVALDDTAKIGGSLADQTISVSQSQPNDPRLFISRFDTQGMGDALRLDFVPGEIIVKYKSVAAKPDSLERLNQKFGLTCAERLFAAKTTELSKIYKLKFGTDANVLLLAEKYASDPNVEYAEPNYIYHTFATPNDSYYGQQWAHQKIQSELAWNIETGRSDVVIAVVDTGVDWNHPDLASNIWNNTDEIIDGIDNDGNGYVDDIRGYDFVDTVYSAYPGEDSTVRDNNPMDFHGHGTHCAGIAAAVTNNSLGVAGVSWNCKIMPVRAGFKTQSGGGTLEDDDAALAIVYAAANNATIISMSWGGEDFSGLIKDALDYAYSKGCVLIGAAGNDNVSQKSYPAGFDNVISIAAADSSDQKASFSNFGSWIDVSAPGVNVLSTLFNDTYASKSGTSMAAPFAAGLAALVLSKNPSFSNEQVLNILRSTCDPVDSARYIGLGRINAYKAVQVDSIMSANINSVLDDANVSATINIVGTAKGENFKEYSVEYGSGAYPISWALLNVSTLPVLNGVLAVWNTSLVPDGEYTVKLTVTSFSDAKSEDRVNLNVKNTVTPAVYIRSDGSVDPASAPILNVGNVSYTFTADIYDSVVVERDNIVVDGAGHMLKGAGTRAGIDLSGRSNVTIKNIAIRDFCWGVFLFGSSENTLYANRMTNNTDYGIHAFDSSDNSIYANTLTNNGKAGIWLYDSSGNSVSANNITSNVNGIYFYYSYNNSIFANTLTNNNYYGIRLETSSGNLVCHNNFLGNMIQAYANFGYPNVWDDGYPSGGNYWSDYAGVDLYKGPYQNETGSDGIGDAPCIIEANNVDNYPLMGSWNPTLSVEGATTWYWISNTTVNSVAVGDVDGDGQKETVTGGTFYDGSRDVAQLVVWNSSSLAPERLTAWYWFDNTTINSVATGDVDGGGGVEIVTGGYYFDGTRKVAQLVVWNGSNLAVEKIRTWYWTNNTVINSVALGDVDGDAQVEIVTGGYYNDDTRNIAQLVVWNGTDLSVDRLTTWYWTNNTVINSVAVGDVDADGQVEIVTGGTFFDDTRDVAQLVVWNGSGLAVDRLTTWYWTNDTAITSVALGDVDADGQTEIVTGGYFNDNARNVAQLVVWTGSALAVDRLTTWYWIGNTVINSVALGDADGDGETEIVTGGYFNDGMRNVAQMVAWSGSSLAAENIRTWYWVNDTTINSLCLSDINGDFTDEIATGGAYNDGSRWNAQLAVWGMRQIV